MSRILLLVFSLSFIVLPQSFAARISGNVLDNDGQPVIGAVVVIKSLGIGTQTDTAGFYEFKNMDNGTYELLFSLVSYKELLRTVSVLNNKDAVLDVQMKPEGAQLNDVEVRATRATNTENAVMLQIRKSNVAVSGISAAQIGKTMDRNAADVVKRIPGVSITDDRFIVIRGLPERYNTVWLNDAAAPSSEVDKRSFSFDVIPSGLIDRIMIYKTPSPDLPGDFAGGMVKVYTSSLPDRNQLNISAQLSHRQGSTGTDFLYDQPSTTDWLGYDDGKRNIPSFAPEIIQRNDSNNSEVTRHWGNDWILKNKKLGPDGRFSLSAAGVVKLGKVRLGNIFGASYTGTATNYSLLQHTYDSTDMTYASLDRQSIHNVNVGLLNNTTVAWGNSKIEFKNLYNQLGKSYVIERKSLVDTAIETPVDEISYAIGYESRAIYTTQLSGTHKTSNDKTKYNWTLGYTDLFKNIPNLKRIKYARQVPSGPDDTTTYMYYAGIPSGSADPVNGGGRYFAELYEHIYSFNHQASQKVTILGQEFELSAGNYIEYKKRYFNQRLLGHSIKPGPLAFDLKSLPLNEIFADSNLGLPNRFQLSEITELRDKYTAENKLIASFAAVNYTYKNFKVLAGVRNEHNDLSLTGYRSVDTVTPQVTTNYWLPSVNASYNITDKSLVRVAYGKTLNRPEFREFSPLFFYDFETRSGLYGALFETIFEDTLKVATIDNYDARWEWYPSQGEMVHVGVFYKKFKNPIQNVILSEAAETRALTYLNALEAYSAGVELEARKNLGFLDDWMHTRIFRNLVLVGNAALIKSEVTNDTGIRSNQLAKVPLQGQSPYMVNLGLFYQSEENGLQGSVLFNTYGPRLVLFGSNDVPNIGELPFDMLDATLTKTFYKHYSITIGAQNILDSKLRRVQDVNLDEKFDSKDLETLSYKPGRYLSVGIKVKL